MNITGSTQEKAMTSADNLTQSQRALYVLKLLKEELPRCFKPIGKKLPLKLGIDIDLLHHYQNDPRFTADDLDLALYFYTRGKNYLESLVLGKKRVDLTGHAVGKVSANEADYAALLLKKRAEKAAKEAARAASAEADALREYADTTNGSQSDISFEDDES